VLDARYVSLCGGIDRPLIIGLRLLMITSADLGGKTQFSIKGDTNVGYGNKCEHVRDKNYRITFGTACIPEEIKPDEVL